MRRLKRSHDIEIIFKEKLVNDRTVFCNGLRYFVREQMTYQNENRINVDGLPADGWKAVGSISLTGL